MQRTIKLLRVADDQVVDAVLTNLSQTHLSDFEAMWKHRLNSSTEEDYHWDWVRKSSLTDSILSYEKYAIECEQITQGMMMIETDWHRSRIEPGKNIIYVDFVATAPWNRPSIQSPPQYRGVGSALLRFARLRSVALEYGGRVSLHALSEAETFYKKQGMMNFGTDPDKENLVYFEWNRIEC